MKKTKPVLKKKKVTAPVRSKALTSEEFLREVAAIRSDIFALKQEMNERFDRHENIILAEYRHRIEDLEGKVRALETRGNK